MLKKRIITAFCLLLVLVAAIWFDQPLPWLTIFIAVWGGLAALEFYKIVSTSNPKIVPLTAFGIIWTILFIVSPHFDYAYIIPILLTGTIVIPPIWLLLRQHKEDAFLSWVWTLTGILYIGWLLSYFVALRLDFGREWVLYACFVTFASDTFAFFIGKTWGKHPLSPTISPRKTQEGAAGGIFGAIVISLLIVWLSDIPINYGYAIILAIVVSIFAQVGDLFESLFKRNMGIKDSGNSLPGHGGFLDRIDSLVFAGVIVYYYVILFGLPAE
ncbi:MAG: phosphatidate cytidylyltransferase [Dehalococcoidales bacterium]|nr:phosphatidate cytidylyltransferase [Dehalococcoidales bacterium]